jgi:uncharacterized protein
MAWNGVAVSETRTYPEGVPSWIDTEQPDPEAAGEFYGRLFGWTVTRVSPPGTDFYAVATLDGRDVAGLGPGEAAPASWNTYIAVDDAGSTADRVATAGGQVLARANEVGPAGTWALCSDPAGARFRLWQAGRRLGAQVVNEPGSWNFSDLHVSAGDDVAFYSRLFGWEVEDLGFATLLRQPGYGDHLQATVDPSIRDRQAAIAAPSGFQDAIAWVVPLEPGATPYWHVSFAVADRDATAALAERLGAQVLSVEDTQWTRTAMIRDPQGALLTASQFTPPQP